MNTRTTITIILAMFSVFLLYGIHRDMTRQIEVRKESEADNMNAIYEGMKSYYREREDSILALVHHSDTVYVEREIQHEKRKNGIAALPYDSSLALLLRTADSLATHRYHLNP